MGKKDKRPVGESSAISTLLGRDTLIEGTLSFRETIRLDGRIKGKVFSPDGTIIVGEEADIQADVVVASAVIRGRVTGCIEAKKRIELYPPAQINGDITAPMIAIDPGVVFNGNCHMTQQAADAGKSTQKKDL